MCPLCATAAKAVGEIRLSGVLTFEANRHHLEITKKKKKNTFLFFEISQIKK